MQTHYLNADFDLGLRPRPGWTGRTPLVRQVRELSVQGLLGAEAGDAVLIRADVPQELVANLERCGLPVPRMLVHPDLDPAARLRPLGWSTEAIGLNRRCARPVDHPAAEVIARVNARSFAFALEAELELHGPGGRVCSGRDELESFLATAPAGGEWVVKAEHGHSGLANRRLRRPRLSDVDRAFVDRVLAEDDRLVVEPWLERERDWCVVFSVPFAAEAMRVHETFCTRDGALIGALFEPDGPRDTPWRDGLERTARRVAGRLEREGYFGPACFDAFSWRDGERVELRVLADLNCRLSMSDGAFRCWRRVAPRRTCYYRFFNRRKLDLPDDLRGAVAACGERAWDRSRAEGIVFASPFRFAAEGRSWRPAKLAVFFFAAGRRETLALESWFRERFEA